MSIKGPMAVLLVAAVMVASAVVIRVWLAAAGAYSGGGPSMFLRVISGVALLAGLLLAGVAVVLPSRKISSPSGQQNTLRKQSEERK